MVKIAIIGAGSITFTKAVVMDILAVPELRDTQFRFMDISVENLDMVTSLMRKVIADNGLPATIEPFTDQREAIRGSDYVLCTVRVGGLEAFAHDVEIPLKYGVDQCVGDTLGPGGIFYTQRSIPVLLDIAQDMREVAPRALLINYANPMAMNSWAVRRAGGVFYLGLCHGVQGGHELISKALELPPSEVDYICAGINHQTWYIQVTHEGKDMLSGLLAAMESNAEIVEQEPVRLDVMRRFGYFSTESNGHLSEYVPWYRKRPAEIDQWIYTGTWIGGRTAGYLNHCRETRDEYKALYPKWMSGELEFVKYGHRTTEHFSYIVESLETGRPYRGHFNIGNHGMITNLPDGCTIEIPCYVDGNGISPAYVGPLPMQCAAICRNTVTVQEMAVEAALTGNKELLHQAILLDPLTASVCNVEEAWAMCDEMLEALAPWMPQYNGEGRTWDDIPEPNNGVLRFPA